MPSNNIQRPNVLYIMSDQHAARVMGCAGDNAADTPNLDRLASEGINFTRAYCPSPVCLPSRMSMLTGQRPHEQQCWTNDDILDSARPTWLHGLGAAGYRPVLIGRMHALGPDQLHGYVERPIGDHSPSWPGVERHSLGKLSKTSGPFIESVEKSGAGQSSYQVMDRDVLAASLDFLDAYSEQDSNEPFCLTASFMLPHPPYVADEADFAEMAERVPPPALSGPPGKEQDWIRHWYALKGLDGASPKDVQRARISYYGLVRELDRSIGQLLSKLNEMGCSDNTLVIYVSDHGDHIGERGLFWKHSFYEESIRVPLIMRWPARIDKGRTIPQPVETGALGDTILSLVGAPNLPNATMTSFAEVINDPERMQDRAIFVEYCTDEMPAWAEGLAVQQRAVILGRYKYVYYHGHPAQLFDLKSDPQELHDLSEDADNVELAQKLRELVLSDWKPDEIAAKVERRKAEKILLKNWAEQTRPTDQFRWDLREDQNYLSKK